MVSLINKYRQRCKTTAWSAVTLLICELLVEHGRGDHIKKDWMGKACGTYKGENSYKVLVGKIEGPRQLATPRHRWEDIIKTDHNEVC